MPNFSGTLKTNEIFSAIYNMIISQQVFADNIAENNKALVDASRVDGSLYGDTKLYYSADVLTSADWGNDAEATNLLVLKRPAAPKCQAVTIDVFRQITLTVDDYLTKRAWGDEGAFSQFNSVMLDMIRKTKYVYDMTTFNAYAGTAKSAEAGQNISVDVTSATTGVTDVEAKSRIEAQVIAQSISDLMVKLEDVSRDYNDYKQLRSYNIGDLIFVWNSDAVNKIEKRDLPTIFHNDIVEKMGQYVLPGRFFGAVNTSATEGKADGTVRSLVEQVIKKTGGTSPTDDLHFFAGDAIPASYSAPQNTSYTIDKTILFKVMHKNSIPFMSAFEVGTSFYNPKSLTTNHYLTWGHNTLEYLKNYPMITVKQS